MPRVLPQLIVTRVSQLRLSRLRILEQNYYRARISDDREQLFQAYVREAVDILVAVVHGKIVEEGPLVIHFREIRLSDDVAYVLQISDRSTPRGAQP
jgi:hypothetical protein